MRGMEQLRAARSRQEKLEAEVTAAAREAARRVAVTLGQDLDFEAIAPRYGDTLYAVTRTAGGSWALAIVRQEDFLPHTAWTYRDCRQFGVHVKDGLVEAMASALCDQLDEEERNLGDFVAPAADDLDIEPADELAEVDDSAVLSALQASCDEIPVFLSRSGSH